MVTPFSSAFLIILRVIASGIPSAIIAIVWIWKTHNSIQCIYRHCHIVILPTTKLKSWHLYSHSNQSINYSCQYTSVQLSAGLPMILPELINFYTAQWCTCYLLAWVNTCGYCNVSIVLSKAERREAKLIRTSTSGCFFMASDMFL